MEKDKALERRFQQVFVKQPNVEDTVSLKNKLGYRDTEGLPEPFTYNKSLVWSLVRCIILTRICLNFQESSSKSAKPCICWLFRRYFCRCHADADTGEIERWNALSYPG